MTREESKDWLKKTCGEGWFSLVDDVYNNLPNNLVVTSVYQKWGALNFDIEPWNEEFEHYLEKITEKSMGVCEVCGAKGKERTINDWVHTLCENHYESKLKNT